MTVTMNLIDYLSEISFTKLKSLYECPRQWQMRYILNAEKENDIAEEFKRGKEVHALVESAILHKDPTLVEEINPKLVVYLDDLIKKNNFIWIENRFEKEIGEFKVVGFPDIVAVGDKEVRVIDIKSQLLDQKLKFSELDKFTQIQLMFYAWLVSEKYPNHAIKVGVISWIGNFPFAEFDVYPMDIMRFQRKLKIELDYAKRTLGEYAEFGFQARPGSWCAYCQYKMSCPSEYKIEDIQSVAGELRKLEEKVEELKKVLKNYTKETGKIIQVGDYEYGWFETQETEIIQIDALIDYLIQRGMNITEFLKPDIRKIISMSRKDHNLLNFLYYNFAYHFRGRKIKGE